MTDESRFKFRAWDKHEQKMYQDVMIYHDMAYEYSCTSAPGIGIDGESINPLATTSAHLEIMQWTGLVDRAGKEIFEGDIVTWEAMGTIYTADVAWIPGQAKFLPDDMNGDVEVIGNVWDQPALLE